MKIISKKIQKYFVFDTETAGLLGKTFAVGYVVVGSDGKEISSGWKSSGLESVYAGTNDTNWLKKNIPEEVLSPKIEDENYLTRDEMKKWFIDVFQESEAILVADCLYPCEAGWLRECELTPCPIHEVATALLMAGKDPIGTYPRLKNEQPKHHPLFDARQSARIFIECINSI